MNFRIGQKVICIDGEWRCPIDASITHGPKKREVCVITGFTEWNSEPFLLLEGYPADHGYQAKAFRPIAETDISIFTAMLNPAPKAPATRELVS